MSTMHSCPVSSQLWQQVQQKAKHHGITEQAFVEQALNYYLSLEQHTLFQVSTSGALVKGVFHGGMRVSEFRQHGDFGLGTFAGLNGEMIMLEGQCYQAKGGGITKLAGDDRLIPFCVGTHFNESDRKTLSDIDSISTLEQQLDLFRKSDNYFLAIRIDGTFQQLQLRTACRASPGEDLVTATRHQSQFSLADISGTLIGFWTPAYAYTFNVAGYHFHFLSDDRQWGGHVLDASSTVLSIQLQEESNLHVLMPDSDEFRSADLTGDPSADLAIAEK